MSAKIEVLLERHGGCDPALGASVCRGPVTNQATWGSSSGAMITGDVVFRRASQHPHLAHP